VACIKTIVPLSRCGRRSKRNENYVIRMSLSHVFYHQVLQSLVVVSLKRYEWPWRRHVLQQDSYVVCHLEVP
jgi:hypothetical protein